MSASAGQCENHRDVGHRRNHVPGGCWAYNSSLYCRSSCMERGRMHAKPQPQPILGHRPIARLNSAAAHLLRSETYLRLLAGWLRSFCRDPGRQDTGKESPGKSSYWATCRRARALLGPRFNWFSKMERMSAGRLGSMGIAGRPWRSFKMTASMSPH
jgi:hypothetical protein